MSESTIKAEAETGTSTHIAAVVLAMLLWSTSYVGTKIAYESFPPITLAAGRSLVALIALVLVTFHQGHLRLPNMPDLKRLALSGLFGITAYFTLQNLGVHLTSASDAALITAAFPAITVLMERAIYGIRIPTRKSVGIVLAIIGVAIVTSADSPAAGPDRLLGNLLLIACGVVWAFYNFTTKTVVHKYPPVTVLFWQMAAGTAAFIPLALIETPKWTAPTPAAWAMLVLLGLFCSVAAFMLYNYGLLRLSAGAAVSLANLVPVFGVIWSATLLHENLTLTQLAGGAVVIVGVFLSVSTRK